MKVIGLEGKTYDVKPNQKFPNNKVGFAVELLDYYRNPPSAPRWAPLWGWGVYHWEIHPRGGFIRGVVAFYFSKEFAQKTAEALQQAYDSGQESFTIPEDPQHEIHKAQALEKRERFREFLEKEKPPEGGERIKP